MTTWFKLRDSIRSTVMKSSASFRPIALHPRVYESMFSIIMNGCFILFTRATVPGWIAFSALHTE